MNNSSQGYRATFWALRHTECPMQVQLNASQLKCSHHNNTHSKEVLIATDMPAGCHSTIQQGMKQLGRTVGMSTGNKTKLQILLPFFFTFWTCIFASRQMARPTKSVPTPIFMETVYLQ